MNRAEIRRELLSNRLRALVSIGLAGLLAACSGAAPAATPTGTADLTATAQVDATSTVFVLTAISRPIPTALPTHTPIPAPPTPTASATAAPSATPPPAIDSYTVQPGDTLLSIAMAHKVSMASIMLKNDLSNTGLVKLGEVLQVPTARTWPDENVYWTVYAVEPGETLLQIAQQNEVAMADLIRINAIADAGAIRVGQKLVIPNTSLSALAAKQRPTAAPQPAAQANAPVTKPTAAPTLPPPPAVAQNIGGADAMRAQLLALYNQARAANGVAPLAPAAALQLSAQLHAQDCAQRGYGSHIGSDGATTAMRVARAGFSGRITGENWAWARSVEQAFDMWYYQEAGGGPHRSNILSPRYTSVGFGVAASNGGYYFIADFGAP